jgi:CBS domain containing-hemolysin-like protein
MEVAKRLAGFFARVLTHRRRVNSEEELKEIISTAEEEGTITEDEELMISRIMKIGDTPVDRAMVPRVDMACVEAAAKMEDVIKVSVERGYWRIPVYHKSLDEIVGVVHMRELLRLWGSKEDLRAAEFARLPYFIPRSKKVLSAIREFQRDSISIAMVIDEYGGVAGLVTMEDLIEEIVGEIEDEIDKKEKPYRRLEDGSILVNARMDLADFNEVFRSKLSAQDVHTIGGFVFAQLGRIPRKGETFNFEGFEVRVAEGTRQRIHKLRVRKT